MTQPAFPDRPTDGELVAYLDGEMPADRRGSVDRQIAADGEVRARLALLASGTRPFRQAYAPLLAEAPSARLSTMLAHLPAGPANGQVLPPKRFARPAWWVLAAAGVVLFVLGAVAGRLIPVSRESSVPRNEEASDDWRQAVAQYLTLYTSETLAGVPDDPVARQRELAIVGTRLGRPLSLADVGLEGLTLKRAQIFHYDGHALAQLLYLDPRTGPVALCVFVDDQPGGGFESERRLGLNIVFWATEGRSYMLIGHPGFDRLQPLAASVSRRLAL